MKVIMTRDLGDEPDLDSLDDESVLEILLEDWPELLEGATWEIQR